MDFTSLLAALQHSPLLAAFALLGILARAWVTDRSAFPLTLPPSWQPVITALAAATINASASIEAGIAWQTVAMTSLAWAATTGFLDGILVAIWGDPKKAPAWARFAVMIFDDVEGRASGNPPTGSSGTGSGGTIIEALVSCCPPGPPPIVPPTPPPAVPTVHSDESTPTLVEDVPHIPSKPPPPEPPAAARAVVSVFTGLATAGGLAFILLACPPTPNLPDAADVAGHYASQSQCLGASDAGDPTTWKAAVDACRLRDFRLWCTRWPAAEDCAPDAGRLVNALQDAGAHE
jgi:hypothetical protein